MIKHSNESRLSGKLGNKVYPEIENIVFIAIDIRKKW